MFYFVSITFSIPSPLLDTPLHSTIHLSDFLSALAILGVGAIISYTLVSLFEKKKKPIKV
jgi:hypothetical protein